MSLLNVNKVDPSTGTALELGSSGDTVSVPSGATLDISASTLTPPATMPASSGINLTALNATNIGSGTVPTARLGTGTASSSTVLYGDQTYKAEPGGGKLLQQVKTQNVAGSGHSAVTTTSATWADLGIDVSLTPTASDSVIYVQWFSGLWHGSTGTVNPELALYRSIDAGADSQVTGDRWWYHLFTSQTWVNYGSIMLGFVDAPATTDVVKYSLYGQVGSSLTFTVLETGATYGLTAWEFGA
jgi:hypothetical protein